MQSSTSATANPGFAVSTGPSTTDDWSHCISGYFDDPAACLNPDCVPTIQEENISWQQAVETLKNQMAASCRNTQEPEVPTVA